MSSAPKAALKAAAAMTFLFPFGQGRSSTWTLPTVHNFSAKVATETVSSLLSSLCQTWLDYSRTR